MLKDFVRNILNSATKIVLLLLAISLCIFVWMWKISEEAFIPIVGTVFWFYFGWSKTNANTDLDQADKNV